MLALLVVAAFAASVLVPDESGPRRVDDRARGSLTSLVTDENAGLDRCTPGAAALARCGAAPPIRGLDGWVGTDPGPIDGLRGQVVLVEFFSYACLSCQRALPQVQAWSERYAGSGLQVVGVHVPTADFDTVPGSVDTAAREAGLTFPIGLDDGYATTTAYRNRYQPATYLVDAEGEVRALHFGEGGYGRTETQLRALLRQRDPDVRLPARVGTVARAPGGPGTTPELVLSASPSASYGGTPAVADDEPVDYFAPRRLKPDSWALDGRWTGESRSLRASGGDATLVVRFTAARAYLLAGGTGSLVVETPGEPDRRVPLTAGPRLVPLLQEGSPDDRTLTVRVPEGGAVRTAAFG
ncbi:redoxin domain-containing protein [Solicola sp. PLA-1-18]|uniref:redoxin domain-containing protein n=1 Tax=Solicola sp. PLA-1-18 TaxID=3380532 RepID=UPI003B79A50D